MSDKRYSLKSSDLIDHSSSKIGAIFFLLLLVIILSLLFTSVYLFRSSLEESEERLVQTVASTMALGMKRVSFSGRFHTELFVDQLIQSNTAVTMVYLIDGQSNVIIGKKKNDFQFDEFFSDDVTGVKQNVDDHGYYVRYRMTSDGKRFKQVIMPFPVSFDRSSEGYLVLGLSSSSFEEQLRENIYYILLFGIVLAIFSANFVFFITRKLSQSIRDFANVFRGMLDHAPMVILLYDHKGRILEMGSSEDSIVKQNWRKNISLSDLFSMDEILQFPLLAPGGGDGKVFHREMSFRSESGLKYYTSIHFPIFLADRRKVFCTMAINIDDEIKLKQELQQNRNDLERTVNERTKALKVSNEELERFSYVASHDLQEPLRMVSSYMQLIVRRCQDRLDDETREFIGFAVDGAERMKVLIDDLLMLSRFGASSRPFSPVDCRKVLSDALLNLKLVIEESHAVIKTGMLPIVYGDDVQLAQLFQNLIGNSIKFRSATAPEVRIYCEDSTDEWVFHVKDNGIGIPAKYHGQIFEVFKRLHNRSHYPGTGIGLAVCKKIVEKHGGSIHVNSDNQAGTEFIFTISKKGDEQ